MMQPNTKCQMPHDDGAALVLIDAMAMLACALQTNGKVTHAAAKTAAGPYRWVDDAVGVWSTGPHIMRATDGTFLLWSMGTLNASAARPCVNGSPVGPAAVSWHRTTGGVHVITAWQRVRCVPRGAPSSLLLAGNDARAHVPPTTHTRTQNNAREQKHADNWTPSRGSVHAQRQIRDARVSGSSAVVQ